MKREREGEGEGELHYCRNHFKTFKIKGFFLRKVLEKKEIF
jgi:hypothetical protein